MSEAYQGLLEIDRIIHEPARLLLVTILSAVQEADFLYLLTTTGLTKGNLSSHLTRLEQAEYLVQEKSFVGKTPRTVCRLTPAGQAALASYRQQMGAVIGE
ncbi:MAG: transcriptional regulator [Ardenticatenaceae bacterium]|nr:transcriptional regulator [Ardenticatenaceae bacterium]